MSEQTCVYTCCKECGNAGCSQVNKCAYLHAHKCPSAEARCDEWTDKRPTDLQRAQWWRDGWRRKYNLAADADKMTVAIELGECYSVVRYWQVKMAAGKVLNTSRETTICQE